MINLNAVQRVIQENNTITFIFNTQYKAETYNDNRHFEMAHYNDKAAAIKAYDEIELGLQKAGDMINNIKSHGHMTDKDAAEYRKDPIKYQKKIGEMNDLSLMLSDLYRRGYISLDRSLELGDDLIKHGKEIRNIKT